MTPALSLREGGGGGYIRGLIPCQGGFDLENRCPKSRQKLNVLKKMKKGGSRELLRGKKGDQKGRRRGEYQRKDRTPNRKKPTDGGNLTQSLLRKKRRGNCGGLDFSQEERIADKGMSSGLRLPMHIRKGEKRDPGKDAPSLKLKPRGSHPIQKEGGKQLGERRRNQSRIKSEQVLNQKKFRWSGKRLEEKGEKGSGKGLRRKGVMECPTKKKKSSTSQGLAGERAGDLKIAIKMQKTQKKQNTKAPQNPKKKKPNKAKKEKHRRK